jgi:hypothetical protein
MFYNGTAWNNFNSGSGSSSGNPFNQVLNTTSNVTFNNITINGDIAGADINIRGSNVSVGSGAGQSGTGNFFTGLGFQAGFQNTGAESTMVGYQSGRTNIGDYLTAIGLSSANANNATYVTALGYNAGNTNSGTELSAVGHQAGYNNRGTQVTALGSYAGNTNTGNYLTALGYQAGAQNTGDYLTALGYQSGYNNTGIFLTTLGYQSGYNNKDSTYGSTLVGYQAGYQSTFTSNTAGITAVGTLAGYNNTNPLASIFFASSLGYRAGYNNKGSDVAAIGGRNTAEANTGSYVSALGSFAAYNNSANEIVAIGYNALYNNTGAYSIGIGDSAGYANTGASSIFIGQSAGSGNTLANQFILKEGVVNSVPLIQGDFLLGKVGINTSTPQNALNVMGDINATGNVYSNGTLLTAGSSSSGSGIVASGSNANGSYIEFSDGTMMEWNSSIGTGTCNNANSPVFYGTSVITFPIPFFSVPTVTIGVNQSGSGVPWPGMSQTATVNGFTLYVSCASSPTSFNPTYFAIGRWTAATNMPGNFSNITIWGLNANNDVIQTNISGIQKVGIGISNPQGALDVNTSSAGIVIESNSSLAGSPTPEINLVDTFSTNVSSAFDWVIENKATNFRISTQPNITATGAVKFFINGTSGNVGLGTSTPIATLGVNGNVSIAKVCATAADCGAGGACTSFGSISYCTVGSAANNYFIGTVGIGTTTPQNTLNVFGDANITGNFSMGTSSIAPGGFQAIVPIPKLEIWQTITNGTAIEGQGYIGVLGVGAGGTVPSYGVYAKGIAGGYDFYGIGPTSYFGGAVNISGFTNISNNLFVNGTNVGVGIPSNLSALGYGTLTVFGAFRSGAFPSIYLGGVAGNDTDFWFARTNNNDNTTAGDSLQIGTGITPGLLPLFTLNSSGNLGINTTNPQMTLTVLGQINLTAPPGTGAFNVYNNSGAQVIDTGTINATGTVGGANSNITYVTVGRALNITSQGAANIICNTALNHTLQQNNTGLYYCRGASVAFQISTG